MRLVRADNAAREARAEKEEAVVRAVAEKEARAVNAASITKIDNRA